MCASFSSPHAVGRSNAALQALSRKFVLTGERGASFEITGYLRFGSRTFLTSGMEAREEGIEALIRAMRTSD